MVTPDPVVALEARVATLEAAIETVQSELEHGNLDYRTRLAAVEEQVQLVQREVDDLKK